MAKPISVSPFWLVAARMTAPLFDQRSNALEVDTAIPVHPDHEGPADQVGLRNETPVTAVLAIIAIIPHCEIVSSRHAKRALCAGMQRPGQDIVFDAGQHFTPGLGAGHLAAFVAAADIRPEIGLRDFLAVHVDDLVAIGDLVSRKADHALDVVDLRVARVAEYEDIAPLRLADF